MKDKILIYGIIGLVGAIGVGIGQFLMHYSAVGYTGIDLFGFFIDIPQKNISIGHSLAVIFLPFYFGGYWHLYLILLPSHPQSSKWVYRLAVCTFSIFAVWIGSQAILSIMVKDDFNNGIEHYIIYNQNLIGIVYVFLAIMSSLIFYIIWSGKTILAKWVALCNPIALLGLIYLVDYLVPKVGDFLMSSPINLVHIVFFGLTVYFVKKSKVTFPSNLDI